MVSESVSQPIDERLLASSTAFARSAMDAYCEESWDVFHLHLATAVEQLIKACLAKAHPSLIADGKADFDSLLHLCGLGARAKTPDYIKAVRTITVTQALLRIGRFVDSYREPSPRVRLLLDTRNAVVHSGHCGKGDAEAIVGDTATYIEQILVSLSLDSSSYWGTHSELVSQHAQRRLSALEASYSRRVQAARARYASLADAAVEALVASTPSAPRDTFDSALVTCPACGHEAELTGFPQPDWEADIDVSDGEAWVCGGYVESILIQADSLRCYVCGLDLDPWLLPFADLEYVTLSSEDYDLTDATMFFERELADERWDDV